MIDTPTSSTLKLAVRAATFERQQESVHVFWLEIILLHEALKQVKGLMDIDGFYRLGCTDFLSLGPSGI